ncbi:MAG: acyl-CoA dehydrogenase family protein [Candidatus Binatia bacterium]|jgi:acyl-CoA dehydrogenase|nr:acyl-CoA dehydrogenase family protein [Candidatus Binatia bacterium]
MDFFFEPDHFELRHKIRSWVEENIFRGQKIFSTMEEEARYLVEQLAREGFVARAVPKKFGGVRESVQARDLCLLREELARGSALADTMFAMQALGSYPITLAGSEEQKARYLPPIARGEAIAAFALTEPQAGSDVSAIETRAVKHGKGYRLSGVKCFISNAGLAQTYSVFALTDPEKKARSLSAFVVDVGTPGFIFKEKTEVISPHPIGVIAFEDCPVPETQRLGSEGEGLKIALATLDTLRSTVGAAALGLAQRALEEAVEYSRNRHQFGQALSQFQATQFKLADMATELEASRLLVHQAAWIKDHGKEGLTQKSSMAKLFATEAAQRIIDQALQIHGGQGVVSGNPVERLYRDVRALRIYEGTSEIQKLIIARGLLGKQGKVNRE